LLSGLLERFQISLAFGERQLAGKKEIKSLFILKSDDPEEETLQIINNLKQQHHTKIICVRELFGAHESGSKCGPNWDLEIWKWDLGFQIGKSNFPFHFPFSIWKIPILEICHNSV